GGAISVIVFTLLAGVTLIPLSIRMWLIPLGFIIACLIVGIGGRIRVLHLLLISFLIYLGLMIFLALCSTLLIGVFLHPLSFYEISQAWDSFQFFVNSYIPFLTLFSDLAALLSAMTGGTSVLAIFLEFLVASLFIGFIGLLITGISGHFTREPGLYVATAPESAVDISSYTEPTSQPPLAVDAAPAYVPAQSSPAPPPPAPAPPMEAPPPLPAPHPVEQAPPPPPSKGGSPSAQAISSLKGKVTKHLKGTGRQAPTGQSRCPHCNATIIHGSRYCNACEKEI
ncbi:MAG: hypothetical protein ACFE9D_04000, partial [Promethearchaeota archaeon]